MVLQREFEKGKEDHWIYRVPVFHKCRRCDVLNQRKRWLDACGTLVSCFCEPPIKFVDVPIKVVTVGIVERAIHSSNIGEKGSEHRAHGTFIKHLVGSAETEEFKQALCAWAPTAMMSFMMMCPNVSRSYRVATLPTAIPKSSAPSECQDSPTAGLSSAALKPDEQEVPPEDFFEDGNPDVIDGKMKMTQLQGDEFGEETRVEGEFYELEPKIGAFQIGPDLISTEVMDSTLNNLKAGLAKRVKPLPFRATISTKRKIDRTVSELIKKVFTPEAIRSWADNHMLDDCKPGKWSTERWHLAVDEAMSETENLIEQTFQIKVNEALPAKGKAPRPIIQCGDKAQVMMKFPVKCFEEILFDYFEDASIKHLPKAEAMERVAKHLAGGLGSRAHRHLVEGDGSAWDSCCGPKIRAMTENRILKHIIQVLGDDPEVPCQWMSEVLNDMDKPKIKGKFKGNGHHLTPITVMIDAIRQSGHAGTSSMNYLVNLVCWLVVIAKEPWKLIGKSKEGVLRKRYESPRDGKTYELLYAFEGDDSAISTTENLLAHDQEIEEIWTSLGFRMKLVFVDKKLTFTGFDFLCNEKGPTGAFVPEIARNIASSSWSCSSLLKMKPKELHQVGAAAMLARACNFKDCGPYSRYFAALGMAHIKKTEDFALGETDALRLGIQVSPSVKEDLQVCLDAADAMDPSMRELVSITAPMSQEDELRLLQADFGTDPFNTRLARDLIPFAVWNPKNFQRSRR